MITQLLNETSVQSKLYKAWIDYIDITQENTIFLATLNSLARAWPSFKELHLLQQGVSFRYFASHGELVESIFRLFNLFPNLHINVDSGCSTFFNFFFALQVRRNFLSERQCGLIVLMEFQTLTNSKVKPFEEIPKLFKNCHFWTQPPRKVQTLSCKGLYYVSTFLDFFWPYISMNSIEYQQKLPLFWPNSFADVK